MCVCVLELRKCVFASVFVCLDVCVCVCVWCACVWWLKSKKLLETLITRPLCLARTYHASHNLLYEKYYGGII